MITLYWVLEYGKVLFGYLFLMFLWPSVVFGKYLSQKSKSYKFSFCVTVQVVLVNTVILGLGFFHLLNRWLVMLIFYGIFFVVLLRKFNQQKAEKLQRIASGSYGIKSFLSHTIRMGVGNQLTYVKGIFHTYLAEYIILAILVLFGVVYFSYGAFQDYSYGIADLSMYHREINSLIGGKIFPNGVCPEGMQSFIYCLNALFGIRVYNVMLFLAGIHVAVLLIAAYLMMREVFYWRYTPLFVLALFLLLDVKYVDAVEGMSRLQWTLPREFALYTQFLSVLYMLRYLKSSYSGERKGRLSKFHLDENLFLFMMSLAAAGVVHFRTAVIAILLCVVFALFVINRVFRRTHFLPLLAAVLVGGMLAFVPMAGSLLFGVPFQETEDAGQVVVDHTAVDEMAGQSEGDEGREEKEDEQGIIGIVGDKFAAVYQNGYVTLYGRGRARWMFWLTEVGAGLCLIFCLSPSKKLRKFCFRYLPMLAISVLYMLGFSASNIGLPQLQEALQVYSGEQILHLMILAIPMDVLFSFFTLIWRDSVMQVLSIWWTIGVCGIILITGNFHGFLYHELPRYNTEVMVSNSIMRTFPRYSYTIVAPEDNMYQIFQEGNHYDMVDFINKTEEEDFTLSTEYVFFYVEKRPIQYNQLQFFEGPFWLAEEKYPRMYLGLSTQKGNGLWKEKLSEYTASIPNISQSPEIVASEISGEAAQMELTAPWLQYSNYIDRAVVESKLYDWCERFGQLYPYEMKVYYEDDDFVCYYFRQETSAPYSLGLNS